MTTINYQNGNADITIFENGDREVKYSDELKLQYPLNIDIRVSTKCSFADNICKEFCHEEAKIDGIECDYDLLKSKLIGLPKGIELAIGSNELTDSLLNFLHWSTKQGYINNLTVNQGHIKRDCFKLLLAIENNWIKGLGISYRSSLKWNIPLEILNYKNTVIHVIMGIDTFEEIKELYNRNVKKILILGEKDFGYNSGKVDISSKIHKQWIWNIQKLFNLFEVVSFDNLAVEQLKLKRFFTKDNWDIFYQGEYSFYINAVDGYFSPSSRSSFKTKWNTSIEQYFQSLN